MKGKSWHNKDQYTEVSEGVLLYLQERKQITSKPQSIQAWKDPQPSINQHSSTEFTSATQVYLHIIKL